VKHDANILIVDDEEDILLSMEYFLQGHFNRVVTENNPYHIPRHLRKQHFDLLLLDMNYRRGDTSGREGMQWLQKIMELQPDAAVVMITAYADVSTAVEAVKAGATDFIEKPWRNEKLLSTLVAALKRKEERKAEAVQAKKKKSKVASSQNGQSTTGGEIVGDSSAMQRVFDLIDKVAHTDANVLILGENGTGKELIAQSIHQKSKRSNSVFVSVDLGAVPETLFESELFGHKKGSFTDAKEDRIGRFEAASGGSLFLDEIGNLSLPLQAKLLTALQNRQIRRLGTNQFTPIDIRLICATNMPLYDMVKENNFRQDLLYRINTVEIKLPPLRERQTDIPLLVAHFLKTYAQKYNKPDMSVSPEAMNELQEYDWPGNIRELRHAVERAVILSEGNKLELSDFILQEREEVTTNTTPSVNPQDTFNSYNLADIEKWAIRKAMTKYQGNISKAADELGLTRAALYRRLAKYDL